MAAPDSADVHIVKLFLAYFQRAPEYGALTYYREFFDALVADGTAEADAYKRVSAAIPDAGAHNGELPVARIASDDDFVVYLYHSVLGRAPDAGGRAYWVSTLADGVARTDMLEAFLVAAEADSRDAAYLDNRAYLAVLFAAARNSGPDVLDLLEYDAAAVMAGVNEHWSTVEIAEGRLWENHEPVPPPPPPPAPETFTLTPEVDDYRGTPWNDTFLAPAVVSDAGPVVPTLQDFDTLDGGAGRDTLIADLHGESVAPTLSRIEVVELSNGSEDTALLDLGGTTGVDTLRFTESEGAISVVNAGAVRSVEIRADHTAGGIAVAGVTSSRLAIALDDAQALVVLSEDGTEPLTLQALTVTAVDSGMMLVGVRAESIRVQASGDNVVILDETGAREFVVTGSGSLAMEIAPIPGAGIATFLDGSVLALLDLSAFAGELSGLTVLNMAGPGLADIRFGNGHQTVRILGEVDARATIEGGSGAAAWSGLEVDRTAYESLLELAPGHLTGVDEIALFEPAEGRSDWIAGTSVLRLTNGVQSGELATVALGDSARVVVLGGDLLAMDGGLHLEAAGGAAQRIEVRLAHQPFDDDETVDVLLQADVGTLRIDAGVDNACGCGGGSMSVNYVLELAASPALTTLEIAGDQAVAFAVPAGSAITRIDASANTAGVDLVLTGAAGLAVTASAGADLFELEVVEQGEDRVVTIENVAAGDTLMLTSGSGAELQEAAALDITATDRAGAISQALGQLALHDGDFESGYFAFDDAVYVVAKAYDGVEVQAAVFELVGLQGGLSFHADGYEVV